MRRTDVPATKSNLLRLKEHFGFIKTGHELLDQKREVLFEELIDIAREAGQVRRQVQAQLAAVYESLREAVLTTGHPSVELETLAPAEAGRLRIRERSIMGVIVPLVDFESQEPAGPAITAGRGAVSTARAGRQVRQLLPLLVRLAEIEVSCRRLAVELQKTRRRVNALEHIFLPEYRDTIHFIESSLEEKEREALFQLKRLKGRREESIR